MNVLLAKGILAATLAGVPAMTQPVYVAEPQAAASVAYVNPHDKDHDKHDKDKHDKDKHDKHDKHD